MKVHKGYKFRLEPTEEQKMDESEERLAEAEAAAAAKDDDNDEDDEDDEPESKVEEVKIQDDSTETK